MSTPPHTTVIVSNSTPIPVSVNHETPPSHTNLFWLNPAPFTFLCLCIAALVALYATCQFSWERENEILKAKQEYEKAAAKERPALQEVLIRERTGVIAQHKWIMFLAGLCFVCNIPGMVLGVARVSFRPKNGNRRDEWFVRGMIVSLWAQVVTVVFAGACMFYLVWSAIIDTGGRS